MIAGTGVRVPITPTLDSLLNQPRLVEISSKSTWRDLSDISPYDPKDFVFVGSGWHDDEPYDAGASTSYKVAKLAARRWWP
jgi:hypothetical protein